MNIGQISDTDFEFEKGTTNYLTHNFHPYFAKFIPQIPRLLISAFSKEKDVVLDPFCGCGTTLVEAKMLNRNSIGVDLNPLGCLISKVKTTPLSAHLLSRLDKFLESVRIDINILNGQNTLRRQSLVDYEKNLPHFHNRDYWFKRNVLNELGIIKAHIDKIEDKDLRDFCLVAFSSIITKVSNQKSESHYSRTDKKVERNDSFFLFEQQLKKMRERMAEFVDKSSDADVKIYNEDLRKLTSVRDDSVDLVVTSPPYLNAWDYNLYQRFRFFWLGMDPMKFKNNEIGAHLLHSYSKNSLEKYRDDINECLNHIGRTLKIGKYCCIVNANAIVRKKDVNTSNIIIEAGKNNDLEIFKIIRKNVLGPHFGRVQSLKTKNIQASGKTLKREDIIILKKHD